MSEIRNSVAEQENKILTQSHTLLCLDPILTEPHTKELNYLKSNFCGVVVSQIQDVLSSGYIYVCGQIDQLKDQLVNRKVFIVMELSVNYDVSNYSMITLGQVPINIHNQGVYFRKFFPDKNYFKSVQQEHTFQSMTQSNKPSQAFREGIYLTPIVRCENFLDSGLEEADLEYHLLRCSSNLTGPTDNFRGTDHEIVDQLEETCSNFFEQSPGLNHVLAQIYKNNQQGKAKISQHSDKTKDMPRHGVIAFTTFYDSLDQYQHSLTDRFDYCYRETSVLTKLYFKLKASAKLLDSNLPKEFTVTLYPNSVFIIPLSTNRLYTHEIKPSTLPFNQIPTRMGYVIRCSKTQARYHDGVVYVQGQILIPGPSDELSKLRELYVQENADSQLMNYGNVNFSMNLGDYMKPIF